MSGRDSNEIAIALGANLGNRLENLSNAVVELQPHLVENSEIEKSPVFATAPVDCPDGSLVFYNAVIIVQFADPIRQLLNITQQIERKAGRLDVEERAVNAPRMIDLDLLYAGEECVDTGNLVLPHPRLHLRRFVLAPLAGLRPNRVLPGFTQSLKAVLDSLQTEEPPLRWVTDDW